MNEKEYEKLIIDVKRSGLDRESFIRSALNHVVFKETPQLEFHDILKQLRQINNSLNQIAMKAHVTGMIDAKRYQESYSVLQEQIGEIIRGIN